MAKYSDIKGFTVQTLSTDTIASQAAGGSWASGGDLNAARESIAGAGSQTAALAFGGNTPGSPKSAANENYNGTSWTELADLNVGRGAIFGYGTTTAAIGSGGLTYPFTPTNFSTAANESWNGSAWTEVNDLNTSRGSGGAASGGTSTAGLVFGGAYVPGPSYAAVANVESWNGTSYTETADLNTARAFIMGGAGVQTAALAYAGTPPTTQKTESWNGSAWTELANLNTTAESRTGSGSLYTAALCFGGASPAPARIGNTELWDGSSWTEVADLSTARNGMAAAGSDTANLGIAGSLPPNVVTVEEWTAPSTFVKQVEGQLFFNSTANAFKETITDFPGATWASATSMNQNRGRAGFSTNVGTPTTHVAFVYSGNVGPGSPGKTVNAEQYDGSSWTEVANVNAVRGTVGGGGTLTASTFAGGEIPSAPSNSSAHEQWDGSSWTETTELNVARRANVGFGATSAAVLQASGYTTTAVAITEQWNGSSWTEVADQNEANQARGGTGTVTDGILFGGYPQIAKTETWDGTSWTEVSDLNTGAEFRAPSGNSSALVLASGGYTTGSPGMTANVEFWNGTSWTEIANLGTARTNVSGTGSATTGMAIGGQSGPPTQITTVEETTVGLANKTITAS